MNPLVESPEILDVPDVETPSTSTLPRPPAENLGGTQLPSWTDAAAFCAEALETPPEIIGGILHRGCKLVIGGSSKSRKSWALLDLALAVSTGGRWLAFPTTQARVLYVNFELPTFAIQDRLRTIAAARQTTIPAALTIWNLRGYAAAYGVLLPAIAARMKGQDFGLVILDPSYKLLGDADENSARDIALLLNTLEKLAVQSGAAIAFTAHFAKGSAAHKDAMDRISGSGVFARDPDSILVFTALQAADAFAVEAILRTLPPHPPFAIRWQYPVFRVADDLDPTDLKQPQRAGKLTPTPEQVLALFKDNAEQPRAALLSAVQLRALFDSRGWDRIAAPAVRDALVAEGTLKVHHGAHNSKLTGLPQVVDSYTKQQAEAGTVLDQPALPAANENPLAKFSLSSLSRTS
ncbi:MAG: AAA family ATPase [Verrucomicrobia bacterium]|nr:AAA family ATPase [Verrucomicrobiota bacterium]